MARTFYYVAMRPDLVKAMGDRIFFTREDAEEYWQQILAELEGIEKEPQIYEAMALDSKEWYQFQEAK